MDHSTYRADFGLTEISETAQLIASLVQSTPCVPWNPGPIAATVGMPARVLLKLELLQVTGTFKVRGVFSVMLRLSDAERRRGVTAVSAGNHAVAVAYAARALRTTAKVVMYSTASPVRIAAARGYGAEVILAEPGQAAFATAERIASEEGRTYVHPFEGRNTSLGTATLGVEFLQQSGPLDAVVVAIGGGGLASGVAAAIKLMNPACAVYGVEPTGADAMHRSLVKGSPQQINKVATIADSLGAPMTLPYSFALCRANLDRVVLVDDEQLCQAMYGLFYGTKLAVEPAGAASVAALLGPLRDELKGARVGAIICGSNIDIDVFAGYVRRGAAGHAVPERGT